VSELVIDALLLLQRETVEAAPFRAETSLEVEFSRNRDKAEGCMRRCLLAADLQRYRGGRHQAAEPDIGEE
jgi:hypothetical protein